MSDLTHKLGSKKETLGRIQKRIRFNRTPGEMKIINGRVKELGKKDLHSFLYAEIAKLEKRFLENPDFLTPSEGKGKPRYHYVPPTTYNNLGRMASIRGTSINAIIEEFIIMPLLHPMASAAQD